MISRRGFACAVVAGCAVLALGGCGAESEEHSAEVRYRVTVEIDEGGAVSSGSGVWSLKLTRPTLALASPYNPKFTGEAVAVDLSNGQTMFALIKDQEMLPERHFSELNVGDGFDRIANIRRIARARGKSKQLACESIPAGASNTEAAQLKYDCPMLVTFKDIADPTSVEQVDPDDLAGSFGQGYRLKSITVQVTDAPVTVGIGDRLHAIGVLRNNSLDKDFKPTTNPTLAQKLGYGDFVRK
jgi:hypothetical protein